MQLEKHALLKHIQTMLQEKEQLVLDEITSITTSRNNEDKSSAGDKHETARAMAQNELEKHQKQLADIGAQKQLIGKIDTDKKLKEIALGALIKCNLGWFFFSCALGKISFNNQVIFALSLASPLGKIMMGKTKGETLSFNNKPLTIEEIY